MDIFLKFFGGFKENSEKWNAFWTFHYWIVTFLPAQYLNKQKFCLQIILLLILDTAPLPSTSNAGKVSTMEGTPAPTSVPVTPGIWNQDLTVTEIAKKPDDKQQIPPPEMRHCKTKKPRYVKKNFK